MLASTLCLSILLTLSCGLQISEPNESMHGTHSRGLLHPISKLLGAGISSLIRAIIRGLLAGERLAEILLHLDSRPHHPVCHRNHHGSNCDYDKCRNNAVADVILMMDSSASVGPQNWQLVLEFAANFTKQFPIGPSSVRFAAITYSWAPVKLFDLKTYTDYNLIEQSLKSARFLNAQTMTYKAYEYIREKDLFGDDAGGRIFAPAFVVLIMQEGSTRPTQTIADGQQLRDDGVRIIGVGIGPNAAVHELNAVATSPDDVILATDFDTMYQIQKQVVRRICEGTLA